jgi:hypothetical protein
MGSTSSSPSGLGEVTWFQCYKTFSGPLMEPNKLERWSSNSFQPRSNVVKNLRP